MQTKKLESNLWKMFLFILTGRRLYIVILSVYFLTLPNTTANQIGLYTGIGALAAFFLEIPSGYFADRFGHKKTLVLAKVLMILSTLSFIFLQNFYGFVLGSIFLSVAFAFTSGTVSAFIHETFEKLGREKEYTKFMGRIRGNVSLVSIIIIIALPFLTTVHIVLPLVVNLIFDFIGLITAFFLINPKTQAEIKSATVKSINRLFKESKSLNFLPFVIFVGAIAGFLIGSSAAFRSVYLDFLGFPIIYLGFVIGFAKFTEFILTRYIHKLEEYFSMKQHLLFEVLFFTLYFMFVAYLSNPYIIAGVFAVGVGYLWGRTPIMESYILKYYVSDSAYKATVLSIKGQVGLFFQFIVPFSIGFVMNHSYKLGYGILGVVLFVILITSYWFIEAK